MMYSNYLKPPLDFAIAGFTLLLLSPVFFVITVLLLANNKGNPFFIQKRPGKNGKIFSIIKFKTMNDKVGADGFLLSDHERLSGIGKAVRKSSLDEIPQLINVLKGEMSLVGPRPLLPEYLDFYTEEQSKRHLVKPGITGWAQVNGRNTLSWEEKFYFDLEYIEKFSARFDAKIVLLTLQKVLDRKGVNADQFYTMEHFKGTTV